MIRVVKMSGRYLGIDSDLDSHEEIENIEMFTAEGTAVILVDRLDDLESIGIDPGSVEMVKRD